MYIAEQADAQKCQPNKNKSLVIYPSEVVPGRCWSAMYDASAFYNSTITTKYTTG